MSKSMKSVLFYVVGLFLVVGTSGCGYAASQGGSYAGGSGTESDPYEIANWKHLENVRDNPGAHFQLTADLDETTKGYTAVASESAHSGKGFKPIGIGTAPFTGTFDGDTHTIEGLYIKGKSNMGLFVNTGAGASIKNLGLVNADLPEASDSTPTLTRIDFGEKDNPHITNQINTRIETGAFDEQCMRLLPQDPPKRTGGSVSFTVSVDPEKRNYLTLRFWGGEKGGGGMFHLYHKDAPIESDAPRQQITSLSSEDGWTELGSGAGSFGRLYRPPYPGAFYYVTTRLPRWLTEGKEEVELRIVSWGKNGHGGSYRKSLQKQTIPSRALYTAYTHTERRFVPPAEDDKGNVDLSLPTSNIEDIDYESRIEDAKELVRERLQRAKAGEANVGFGMLARAYDTEWTGVAGEDWVIDRLVDRAVEYLDGQAIKLATEWNGDISNDPDAQSGFGYSVGAGRFNAVSDELIERGYLSERLEDYPDNATRGQAYEELFAQAFEHKAGDRKHVTNQMLYTAVSFPPKAKALDTLESDRAPYMDRTYLYLDQAMGLAPHHYFNKNDQGEGVPWYSMTPRGSTKETGWVCAYGKMIDNIAELYESWGAERFKERAIDLAKARAPFRHPAHAGEGRTRLGIEGVVGMRNIFYPADVGGFNGYGHKPFYNAAVLQDPVSVRTAELALKHNQDYTPPASIDAIEHFETFLELPPSDYRLPFERDGVEQVWADPQVSVVAIRDGDETIYVNFAYRADYRNNKDKGVNFLGRFHHRTPKRDTIANVDIDVEFTDSGETWERPDYITGGGNSFAGGNWNEPKDGIVHLPEGKRKVHDANAGQKLPLRAQPNGEPWPAENDNRQAFGGEFFRARWGPYLIGMNTTGYPDRGSGEGKTFTMEAPEGAPAKTYDMASGNVVDTRGEIEVPPDTTRVIRLDPRHADLSLDWQGYAVAGEETTIRANLDNIHSRALQNVVFELTVPDGWETNLERVEGLDGDTLAGDQTATAVWTLRPPKNAILEDYSLSARAKFDAGEEWGGTDSARIEDNIDWQDKTVRRKPEQNAVIFRRGETNLDVTVTNPFPFPIRDVSLTPTEGAQGWDIQPAGDARDVIDPEARTTLAWTITPPEDGDDELALSLSYVRGNDGKTVRAEPPITATIVSAGDNIAPFGTPFASSTHGRFHLDNIINGETSGNWGSGNGWNDATSNEWPDWAGVKFDNRVPISRVDVWTRPGNERIRDFAIQVFRDGSWQTVASVEDNRDAHIVSRFEEVTTDKVRILVRDGNRYSRVMELQIFNE